MWWILCAGDTSNKANGQNEKRYVKSGMAQRAEGELKTEGGKKEGGETKPFCAVLHWNNFDNERERLQRLRWGHIWWSHDNRDGRWGFSGHKLGQLEISLEVEKGEVNEGPQLSQHAPPSCNYFDFHSQDTHTPPFSSFQNDLQFNSKALTWLNSSLSSLQTQVLFLFSPIFSFPLILFCHQEMIRGHNPHKTSDCLTD